MSRDGITGLVCLAASLVLLALTYGLPGPSLLVPIGPGFYPRIILGIAAVFSLMLLVQELIAHRRARVSGSAGSAPRAPAESRPNYVLVLLTFAVFGVYVGVLPYVGYRISTFAFVLGLQALLDPPKNARRWGFVFVLSLATTLVTFYLFQNYLQVLLPHGRWTDF